LPQRKQNKSPREGDRRRPSKMEGVSHQPFKNQIQEIRFLGGLIDPEAQHFRERNTGFAVATLSTDDFEHPISKLIFVALCSLYLEHLDDLDCEYPFYTHELLIVERLRDLEIMWDLDDFDGDWLDCFIDAHQKLGASEPWAE